MKRAGEEAERRWRIKEGMVDVDGLATGSNDAEGQGASIVAAFLAGHWSLQKVVDWGVEKVIEVEA